MDKYVASYYGGLHCGDCFDVFTRGKWKPTRIEMNMAQEWYLVGIRADDLNAFVTYMLKYEQFPKMTMSSTISSIITLCIIVVVFIIPMRTNKKER